MMRPTLQPTQVYWIVGVVAAGLFFHHLGTAPFLDPPEGLHASIAQEMVVTGEWLTPHFNGVRYFDKPPLPYWLMASAFSLFGPSEWTARLWSALFAVAIAMLTAWFGMRIGSPRLGLIAGLIVTLNLGMFVFGRLVKPDMLFIFLILLALASFSVFLLQGRRHALLICYASLGASVIAKDILGVIAPVVAIGILYALTRPFLHHQGLKPWFPGAGLLACALVGLPWYIAMEWANPGFLWYTIMDKHLLNVTLQRQFPDEDVPLSAGEFLGVTGLAFFPWVLALPFAVIRVLRSSWTTPLDRVWLLLVVWTLLVLGFFTVSPFKLPHYGLPAFPAMALLAAKIWDEALEATAGRFSFATLLGLPAVVLGGLAAVVWAVWQGAIEIPRDVLEAADLSTRNFEARRQSLPFFEEAGTWLLIASVGVPSVLACAGLLVGWGTRSVRIGLTALTCAMAVFLGLAAKGFELFAENRTIMPIVHYINETASRYDLVVHEGALENSGTLVLYTDRQVKIVKGKQSNLAFGATFPEAQHIFWDQAKLRAAWTGPGRVFLVSVTHPDRSVVRALDQDLVHLLLKDGGSRLYSNRPAGRD